MWQITTLTEFTIESKSIQKLIFDRFCPFGQKPDKCQFCYQVWHPCKCLDKVKVILVFTHGENLRQIRHLPPLPLMQNYGKVGPMSYVAKLSKIKQMWHLQMICSKFAIEVNPFFRPVSCTGANQEWSLAGTLTAGCFRRLPFHEPILIRIKADPNYLDRLNWFRRRS